MNNDSFFSIDRLVEFGLGMNMARQMVDMMNQTMQTMYVPGTPASIQKPQQAATIYVGIDGKSTGPMSESEFTRLVTDNKVTKDSLVWMPGMATWQPLEQVPQLLRLVALAPPPFPQPTTNQE